MVFMEGANKAIGLSYIAPDASNDKPIYSVSIEIIYILRVNAN